MLKAHLGRENQHTVDSRSYCLQHCPALETEHIRQPWRNGKVLITLTNYSHMRREMGGAGFRSVCQRTHFTSSLSGSNLQSSASFSAPYRSPAPFRISSTISLAGLGRKTHIFGDDIIVNTHRQPSSLPTLGKSRLSKVISALWFLLCSHKV